MHKCFKHLYISAQHYNTDWLRLSFCVIQVQDAQATMRLYTLVKKQWEAEIKAHQNNKDSEKKSQRKPKFPKNKGKKWRLNLNLQQTISSSEHTWLKLSEVWIHFEKEKSQVSFQPL